MGAVCYNKIMRNIIVTFFVIVLALGMSIASPAQASPAAPSFFEGVSEWFGDVFTFGDVARAERNIKKAEAVFQDLSDNAPKDDSLDAFFKTGLANYQKRVENAKFYLERAKQKGNDVTSIGSAITDTTARHLSILENAKKQWGDKSETIGLLRALEVVKETNTRAREAIGQALEKKIEREQNTIPSQETKQLEQSTKTEKQVPATANPQELFGWWEEIESWSIDPQGGIIKKSATTFPFLREFTNKYFCTQYSAKFVCANNIPYSLSGNRIFLEGSSNFYEWRIADGKLELASKDSKGRTFDKSLSKKIGPPTSIGKITAQTAPQPRPSETPKAINPEAIQREESTFAEQANLSLVKASNSGICLKHDGGKSINSYLSITINGGSWSLNSFGRFPNITDLTFDAGEAFVYAIRDITIKVGDKIQVTDDKGSTYPRLSDNGLGYWIVKNLVSEEIPKDKQGQFGGLISWGGFASCP